MSLSQEQDILKRTIMHAKALQRREKSSKIGHIPTRDVFKEPNKAPPFNWVVLLITCTTYSGSSAFTNGNEAKISAQYLQVKAYVKLSISKKRFQGACLGQETMYGVGQRLNYEFSTHIQ